MAKDPLGDFKGKTIQDLLNETNPKFYILLKDALSLNKIRAVELCTYLLNFQIQMNYFNSFKTLIREVPELLPDPENPLLLNEFLIGSERIYGIILILLMKFNSFNILSLEETNQEINKLVSDGPLVNRFFIFNTIYPKNYDLELIELLDKVRPFRYINSLIPDLEFDPEFDSVLNCEALKQVYDTSFIIDYLNSKLPKQLKFPPEKKILDRFQKAHLNRDKKLFKINYNLNIAKFMSEYTNYSGGLFLGSIAQIDKIIDTFKKYYVKKVPSKRKQISANLLCFGEFLKLTEGRLFIKLRYGNIVKKIKGKVSKYDSDWFFKRFCQKKEYSNFPNEIKDFNARDFLGEYNKFLSYCMFNVSGFVYTGVFLVWRALIKYLERIQRIEEFKKKKASLLENWCYYKAEEEGFCAEKIVLLNPKIPPSDKYDLMREQTKDFPKLALEMDAKFPKNSKSSFEEIDLAIKVDEYLFIFDCKGTSIYRGEQDRFMEWIDNFNKNIRDLEWQGHLIIDNINNNYIKDPFFQGVKYFIPHLIQTEGIFTDYMVMSTRGYQRFLKELSQMLNP